MTDNEQIADIFCEMLGYGYCFTFGPHHRKLRGFFASFYKPEDLPECDGCGETVMAWNHCGHADTLLEAVEMGRAIALGFKPTIPNDESFKL